MKRMTDEVFQSWVCTDEAGELGWFEDSKLIVDLWFGMAAEREHAESLQAKIDELMLEYCPEEMTPEQFAEWEKHQVPAEFQIAKKASEEHAKHSPNGMNPDGTVDIVGTDDE